MDTILLQKLQNLLKQKRSFSFYAEKLGVTEETVKELIRELRNPQEEQPEAEISNKIDKGILEINIDSFRPKTIEELVEEHKIDLNKYKVVEYYSKKSFSGKFRNTLKCSLKKPNEFDPREFEKFLKDYQPKITKINKIVQDDLVDLPTVDVELSIFDFHLAKKTLEGETIEDKKEQFVYIVTELLLKVLRSYNINKLVFPISNDFFHSDNYQNTTTNGTPQDVLVGYDKEYEHGFDLLAETVATLKDCCEKLEVILVQGNHDRTKSFYLAHALEVLFKNDKSILFKREHSTTKSTVLGNTFIGYHHGNTKIEDLPLLFATGSTSKDFGNALYREIHTGDKHHYMAKEIKGVRIQQMPSLSGTDRWHNDNNYVNNIRAGIITLYDEELGRIGEFEHRIKNK